MSGGGKVRTMRCVDAHNHLQDERLRPWLGEIIETSRRSGVVWMVANGACESDWGAVAEIARAHPGLVLPSFGWHPWWLHEQETGWEERLEAVLKSCPAAGVGECGLDKWIHEPGAADRLRRVAGRGDVPPAGMDRQVSVLRVHLRLATEMDRPLSLHCLRAWGPMLEVLAGGPLPGRGFLLHSYGGPVEMVPTWVRMGAYFGFPGYFLHERKKAQREVFRSIPLDRLLVESDAPDQLPPEGYRPHRLEGTGEGGGVVVGRDVGGLNHPANVGAILRGLAETLRMPCEDLAGQLEGNFARWWWGTTQPGWPKTSS